MTYQEIIVHQENNVAWITLNRPDKLNALTQVMISEWRSALEMLKDDIDCRVIVVNGAGKSWSAGVDLAVFQEIKVEPGFKMFEDGVAIMNLLETMPKVTIAMLNGYCFTGALELIMAFDLIYAAEEAKIGDTHAKWGIPPKWGMTQRLMHQVGMRKAKEMSFSGIPITGKEAEQIGLVNKAVPLDQLKTTVDLLIKQILENSHQAIGAIKEMYHYGSRHSLTEGLKYEKDYEVEFTDKKDTLKNFKDKLG